MRGVRGDVRGDEVIGIWEMEGETEEKGGEGRGRSIIRVYGL